MTDLNGSHPTEVGSRFPEFRDAASYELLIDDEKMPAQDGPRFDV